MCSKDVQKMYNIPVTILDKTTLHTSLPIDILVLFVITNNRLFPKKNPLHATRCITPLPDIGTKLIFNKLFCPHF